MDDPKDEDDLDAKGNPRMNMTESTMASARACDDSVHTFFDVDVNTLQKGGSAIQI